MSVWLQCGDFKILIWALLVIIMTVCPEDQPERAREYQLNSGNKNAKHLSCVISINIVPPTGFCLFFFCFFLGGGVVFFFSSHMPGTHSHIEMLDFYLPQFREEWEITWERKRAQVIVSVVLGKVRRAVVQLLLSLKFFRSLGVYPCSFRLCVVLLFYKVALPVQVRNQFNFCQISNRLNTVQ